APGPARARAGAVGRPGGPPGGAVRRAPGPGHDSSQAVTAPLPRPDAVQATRPMRERQQTPPPGRERGRRPGPPRGRAGGRAGDRQHATAPGGRPGTARQRLLRQRLVVFVVVTVGVALAIAAAQGCENRDNQGMRPSVSSSAVAGAPGPAGAGEEPNGGAPAAPAGAVTPSGPASSPAAASLTGAGLSADGIAPSTSPPAAAAHGGVPVAGDTALAPAQGAGPTVDWPNRSYTDPAGGPAITLRDGRSAGSGPQVVLSAVLPARYKGGPAALVVLRRSEGSVPVDLVQLFSFTGDTPVALASRSSAADPQATATWRLDNGALVREERVAQTGAATSTRYAPRADGTLDESWPGSATTPPATPPPAAAPAPPTAPAG
ncbi:hypothetical protein ACFP3U_33525, partial [Kitasatospora misakiensis]